VWQHGPIRGRGIDEVLGRDGCIPDSVHIPLSVLEWRVDPTSGHQSAALAGREDDLILICHEGHSSSLAAVRLHELGFGNTTDVIGGDEFAEPTRRRALRDDAGAAKE
jgi:hypothetical protein